MTEPAIEFSDDLAHAAPWPGQRIPVSVVIPTLNEAPRLQRLLPTLSWAEEVIVIDGGSTDRTLSVARDQGARVLSVHGQTIGAQRNAGIRLARNHWILALDADEMVSRELRDDLAALCASADPMITVYRVRSRNWYLGRELRHGPWGRDWKVRIFTGDHRFSNARVHENLLAVDRVGTLPGTLLHWPYRDVQHHVSKGMMYTQWAAEDLRERGRAARALDVLVRPAWRFARDYILYSGWRDGMPGFVASVVSAFYVFLKYSTLLTEAAPPAG